MTLAVRQLLQKMYISELLIAILVLLEIR